MSAGCLDPMMHSEEMVGPYVVFVAVAPPDSAVASARARRPASDLTISGVFLGIPCPSRLFFNSPMKFMIYAQLAWCS
jgi:hypothetical protein